MRDGTAMERFVAPMQGRGMAAWIYGVAPKRQWIAINFFVVATRDGRVLTRGVTVTLQQLTLAWLQLGTPIRH